MTKQRKLMLALGTTLGLLLVAALLPMRMVSGDEMAWTFQDGDLVWLLPVRVRKADVVRVADPLDPSRTVLRRVIGLPGQKIKVDDQGVRINGKRLRQEEMGDLDGKRVLKEVIWSSPPARANAYLPMIADQPGGWKNETPVEVPEGYLYLMADNRDGALDSRWWGPVPLSAVQGVVRLRVGKADTWRPQWELMIPKE